jgi:transcriptional regulator with XRE-family HTH domain
MRQSAKREVEPDVEPVRVLGRGLRAARGIHLSLRTLREAAGKTQVEVAQESQMDQADVSRLETRRDFDDCQVATLQRYVKALGGELELVARFGDKKIAIVGVQPTAVTTTPDNKALQRTGRKPPRR